MHAFPCMCVCGKALVSGSKQGGREGSRDQAGGGGRGLTKSVLRALFHPLQQFVGEYRYSRDV